MMRHRRPRPLAPEERTFRDDRLIVVVTEDTYAPEQYFNLVQARRVRVRVAAAQGGHGSPHAILASGRALREDPDFEHFDEFWLLLDTDHWTQPNHIANFMAVQKQARDEKFEIAVSNPCFDLWLLLHHDDIRPGAPPFPNCKAVAVRFQTLKGDFSKRKLNPAHYNVELALAAIARARVLTPDGDLYQPANPGTQVWRLAERALIDVLGRATGAWTGTGA